jgi:hypothetical protein
MSAQIEDTMRLGLQEKHADVCLICGALLASDPDFQALHMSKEHGLIT